MLCAGGAISATIQQTFSLHQWEAGCLSNPARKHLVSPVVAATLLEFDTRIVTSYLFVPSGARPRSSMPPPSALTGALCSL